MHRFRITIKASASIGWFGFVLAVILAGMLGSAIWLDRQRTIDDTLGRADDLARALDMHLRTTLDAIDQGMESAVAVIDESDFASDLAHQRLYWVLAGRASAVPNIHGFFVLDHLGRVIASSDATRPLGTSLADRDAYQRYRTSATDRLVLDRPEKTPSIDGDDDWSVLASRRISTADGDLAGVIVASVDLRPFNSYFEAFDVGRTGAVGVARSDGIVLSVTQGERDRIGKQHAYTDTSRMAMLPEGAYSAVVEGGSDRLTRLVSVRAVPGHEVFGFVAFGIDEVLQPWRERARLLGLLVGGLIIGMLLLFIAVSRGIAREMGTRARMRETLVQREQQQRQYARQLADLANVSLSLSELPSLDEMADRILRAAIRLTGSDVAALKVEPGSAFEHPLRASIGRPGCDDPGLASHDRANLIDKLEQDVVRGNRVMRLTRRDLEGRVRALTACPPAPGEKTAGGDTGSPPSGPHHGSGGWIGAPLVDSSNRCRGVLSLSTATDRTFSVNDEMIVTQLAQFASVAIQNGRLHEALKRSRQDLLEAERIARLGTWRLSADRRRIVLSPQLNQILGLEDAGTLSFDAAMATIHPDDRPRVLEQLQCAADTGERVGYEFRVPMPDGGERVCWAEALAEPDASGCHGALFGLIQDITERRAVEEHLRHAQKLEALGQMTGGVAHDFNNLLTVMLGNLEMIQEDTDLAPDTMAALTTAHAAAQRATGLTTKLLAFSRKQVLSPRPSRPDALITGIEDLLQRSVSPGASLELRLASDLWQVNIDRGQFENALINLAINARDAMQDGGRLVISAVNLPGDRLMANGYPAAPEGDHVAISLSDTGHGMSPALMERVFEPFFTTKREGKGTGLGLSMVYGFISQSGAHMHLESTVGAGTTVFLYLPRCLDDVEENEAAPSVTDSGVRPGVGTILLVERDDTVRETLGRALSGLGYTVIKSGTADDALGAMNREAQIDGLMTDCSGSGGRDAQALARSLVEHFPTAWILFMANSSDPEAIALDAGLANRARVLTKPFRTGDMAEALEAAIDLARSADGDAGQHAWRRRG